MFLAWSNILGLQLSAKFSMAETVTETTSEAPPKSTPEAPPEATPEGNPMVTSEINLKAIPEAAIKKKEEEEEEEFVQVAIPIFKNVTAIDLVGPLKVLHLLPHVKVMFVSHAKESYMADLGMLFFHATATFDKVLDPDIIVVPGGEGVSNLLTDATLLDWILKINASSLPRSSVKLGTRDELVHNLGVFGVVVVGGRRDSQGSGSHNPLGKIITAAGMTAGIDMAFKLAALITDETSARVVQLMMEYDPQPPFHCGSVDHATPDTISRAKYWLENLNGWTICPDTPCFFHSPPAIEREDTTNVSTEETAPESVDNATLEAAPSESKPLYTAPFIDQEPVERPSLAPPENNIYLSTVPTVEPAPPT